MTTNLTKEEGDLIYTFYNITGGYNYLYEDPDSPFNDALLQMEIDMQRGGEYAYH